MKCRLIIKQLRLRFYNVLRRTVRRLNLYKGKNLHSIVVVKCKHSSFSRRSPTEGMKKNIPFFSLEKSEHHILEWTLTELANTLLFNKTYFNKTRNFLATVPQHSLNYPFYFSHFPHTLLGKKGDIARIWTGIFFTWAIHFIILFQHEHSQNWQTVRKLCLSPSFTCFSNNIYHQG